MRVDAEGPLPLSNILPRVHPSLLHTPPLLTWLPSISASEHCPPSLSPKKDLVSSPFKSVIFSLDYKQRLQSPGKLFKIPVPRPGPEPKNSDCLGKGSDRHISKSPGSYQCAAKTERHRMGLGTHSATRVRSRCWLLPVLLLTSSG